MDYFPKSFYLILANMVANAPVATFCGGLFLLETSLLFFSAYIRNYCEDKTIYVIRGVPGVGKKHLIADLEIDNLDEFAVCDRNQYFITNTTYKFRGEELSHAEQSCRIKLLDSIKNNIKNIYILGYFNELWMYQEYRKLAEMTNYKFKVIEIPCLDEDQLSYFNSRAKHKTPFSKSKKCFNNWQTDSDAIYYEPYIPEFPGDVIPKIKGMTKVQLDEQLEKYYIEEYSGEKTKEDIIYDEYNKKLLEYGKSVKYIDNNSFREAHKLETNNLRNRLPGDKKYDVNHLGKL